MANAPFPSLVQRQALYSATPQKHERHRNVPANCTTLFALENLSGLAPKARQRHTVRARPLEPVILSLDGGFQMVSSIRDKIWGAIIAVPVILAALYWSEHSRLERMRAERVEQCRQDVIRSQNLWPDELKSRVGEALKDCAHQ
jgi:hypothetical protein